MNIYVEIKLFFKLKNKYVDVFAIILYISMNISYLILKVVYIQLGHFQTSCCDIFQLIVISAYHICS